MLELTRSSLDSSLVFLALVALITALLTARAVSAPHRIIRPVAEEAVELGGAMVSALLASALIFGDLFQPLPVFALTLGTAAVLRHYVHRLSMPGIIWLTVEIIAMLVSALWTGLFVTEAAFPSWMEALALAALLTTLLIFGVGLAPRIAREAVLTHELWRLPTAAPAPHSGQQRFKVSLHLPCYAEPPEVVKDTMDRLAALDYDNYEVLVCDNNTRDETLWRPLEVHCAALNRRLGVDRFRFFHVSPLPGAKAGALNFCLEQIAADADLVAVVDADYHSRPDFLSRLTTFFDDPKIGYVQTPHDYRDHEHSPFLTACYWEYMPNNKVDMPGVSEYGGAFTIGTMCILRTQALRKIGGWAEWCLTEDSEVSVRLRAAGYRGIYLVETFGRGLIPDTFDDYKKQRFRWTAGPVQQLRRHWRLFLPSPLAPPMPGWTKLLEILRCISPLQTLLGILCGFIGVGTLAVALAAGDMRPIDVPNAAWLLLILGAITWCVRTAHRYRLAGCDNVDDMVRGEIARMSLTYVVLMAGVAGLSNKPLAWRRTPKFSNMAAEPSPLSSTMPETVLGCLFLLLALLTLFSAPIVGHEVAFLTALGMIAFAVRFFCAPYMAVLGIRHLQKATPAQPILLAVQE